MFLREAPETEAVRQLYEGERAQDGFVMNLTRVWAWNPAALTAYVDFRGAILAGSGLTRVEQALLVCATAATMGDSYCALAWGARLASLTSPATAAAVIRGDAPANLEARERALLHWARAVVSDPAATHRAEVEAMREAGLGDREIFSATALVAARQAFSTINDALGALPDREVYERAPEPVRAAVTFGRPVE